MTDRVRDSRQFYRTSEPYHGHLRAKDATVFEPYVRFVGKHVPPGSTVLDLGCGTGAATGLLRTRGYAAVGCDLLIPRTGVHEAVSVLCEADGLKLPFPDQTFDAVACCSYLEHVPDPGVALTEMLRVCTVGGLVLIDGPNHLSPIHPAKAVARHLAGLLWASPVALLTPYGNTLAAITGRAIRNLIWLLRKSLTRSWRFIPRQPDYSHPEIGGDLDALWWCNPLDIKHWLRQQGQQVVAYQCEGRTRFMGGAAAGTQVVARRTRPS